MPKPAHNNYDPAFDSFCSTVLDERVFPSQRQKNMMHMNGVMPAEYADGFSGASVMHNFIDAKVEQSRAFSEQFNGAKPANVEPLLDCSKTSLAFPL